MEFVGTRPINPYSVSTDVATVATPNIAYKRMEKKWKLVEALRGGTETMREKAEEYLPREPKESVEAYEIRLNRTELYNLYNRTLVTLTGIAFTKPIVVSNVPPELEYLEFNADGTGRSLNELAYDMALDAIHYGLSHILTDFPETTEATNLAEFRAKGYKPYFNQINPTRLIGFSEGGQIGLPVLSNVRIMESKVVPREDNKWLEKEVFYVRLFTADSVELWEYDPEKTSPSFERIDVYPHSLGYIPLNTVYSTKRGFMEGNPALYDLARMNLLHWQSSSDQRNILHIARVPFLFASGFAEGELENTEIGANRIIVTDNVEAKIGHVEHTGKAIDAGRTDLKDIEGQIATLGADVLMSKGASRVTASARKLDQNESMSVLQMVLRGIENSLERSYKIAGEWLGVDASNVSIAIGDDLSIANEPNPTIALIALRDSGLLTDEQVVEEAKRQGILSSYFKLSEQRPSLLKPDKEEEEEEIAEEEDELNDENGEISDKQ